MKKIIYSLIIGFYLPTSILPGQIIKVVENLSITNGTFTYSTPGTLISPSLPSNPATLSQTSKVDYLSLHEIGLFPGFSAQNYNLDGYFHAGIDQSGYDINMNSSDGNVPEFTKLEFDIKVPLSTIKSYIRNFITSSSGISLNPFDPGQVNIVATFTSPNNVTRTVYGFYYRKFQYGRYVAGDPDLTSSYNLQYNDATNDGLVRWAPIDDDFIFKVRFSPDEIGAWKCNILMNYPTLPGQDYTFGTIDFNCVASSEKGYITTGNNGYLKYSKTNESFFPVGAYMGPANFRYDSYNPSTDPTNPTHMFSCRPIEYSDFYDLLQNTIAISGGNYIRAILAPQSWAIEWEELGNYYGRLSQAWELDKLIELAEQNDIYLDLAMIHGLTLVDLDGGGPHDDDVLLKTWYDNPYKSILAHPEDPSYFFTDIDAVNYYKRFIRYFVSRWGYSTHVAKFELGNELSAGGTYLSSSIDNFSPYSRQLIPSTATLPPGFQFQPPSYTNSSGNTFAKEFYLWNQNIAGYIRNNLQLKQLISTSYVLNDSDLPLPEDGTFSDPLFQTTCVHSYRDDLNSNLIRTNWIKAYKDAYQKPFMFEEIASNNFSPNGPNYQNDIEMHNTSWATAFMGAFGTTPVLVPGRPGYPPKEATKTAIENNMPYLVEFFNGIDFENHAYLPWTNISAYNTSDAALSASMDATPLEMFLLRGDNQTMGWIHTRRWYWGNHGDGCEYIYNNNSYTYHINDPHPGILPGPVTGMGVTVPVLNSGIYTVQWFNTRTGTVNSEQVSSYPVFPNNNHVFLSIPTLSSNEPDIAFKLYNGASFQRSSVSIGEQKAETPALSNGIQIYPNPGNGAYTISVDKSFLGASFEIYDVFGKIINKSNLTDLRTFINITEQASGVYYIKINSVKSPLVQKLIKQ